LQSVATNLRRSTRKRRVSVNLEDYTDSSGTEDEDLMVRFITLSGMHSLWISVYYLAFDLESLNNITVSENMILFLVLMLHYFVLETCLPTFEEPGCQQCKS
jgi:hypothetical protein